jgi:hypothetical protein
MVRKCLDSFRFLQCYQISLINLLSILKISQHKHGVRFILVILYKDKKNIQENESKI